MLIRVKDTVEVIAGDDRKARGKVLRVNRATGRVVVEGVNRVFKHVRRSQRNPQGGRLSREMPIALSKVALAAVGEIADVAKTPVSPMTRPNNAVPMFAPAAASDP